MAEEDGVKEFFLAHPQSFELVENGGSNKIHIAFCEKKQLLLSGYNTRYYIHCVI